MALTIPKQRANFPSREAATAALEKMFARYVRVGVLQRVPLAHGDPQLSLSPSGKAGEPANQTYR